MPHAGLAIGRHRLRVAIAIAALIVPDEGQDFASTADDPTVFPMVDGELALDLSIDHAPGVIGLALSLAINTVMGALCFACGFKSGVKICRLARIFDLFAI